LRGFYFQKKKKLKFLAEIQFTSYKPLFSAPQYFTLMEKPKKGILKKPKETPEK